MFILVPAYPGCPGSMAVKRSLLLLLLFPLQYEVHRRTRIMVWRGLLLHVASSCAAPGLLRPWG